ncbi:MAG: PAS domain S-box protein [Candidatus Marinimicrobia bacterium]|nr:PAS domain S-box protein [Candidatus Neomarinimicrobiota bacterium]MCF7828813.1 PAS domain S-box protein [Candidatus Neomarinimicrobiota bacterium]MCF7880730.1 PAS domain S-box protein [Candidatus Neomarinimicrobiota bacterium]
MTDTTGTDFNGNLDPQTYKAVFHNAYDAIFLVRDGHFIDCNPKAEEMFGYSREEFLHLQPAEVSPEYQPDGQLSREKSKSKIQAALNGTPQRFEWKHMRADSTPFDADVSLNRIDVDDNVFVLGIVRDITERKRIEERITYQASLLNEVEDAIIATDMNTIITHWNAGAEQVYGISASDAIDKTVEEVFGKALVDEIRGKLGDSFKQQGLWRGEFNWKTPDGIKKTVEGNVTRLTDEAGGSLGTIAIYRDVTDRKETEQRIRELSRYPEENPTPVMRVECDGNITYTNSASAPLLEYWEITANDMLPPDIAQTAESACDSGENIEAIVETDESIYSLLFAPQPESGYVYIYGKEVTETRSMQRALEASEERYRAFIENSNEGIWRFEIEDTIPIESSVEEHLTTAYNSAHLAECNDAMARMYGYENKDDLIGARLSDLLPPEDPDNLAYIKKFFENGFKLTNEITHEKDLQGEEHIFNNSLVGIEKNGSITRIWGTQQDITEQKNAEQALRESEEKFRALTETASSAILIFQDDSFVYGNKALTELTGYSSAELSRIQLSVLVAEEYKEHLSRILASESRENQPGGRMEFRITTKDGQERWIDFTATEIEYHGKTAQLGTAFDITERKRGELVQSAVFQISEIVHTTETLDEVYKRIHEIIQNLMPAKNFYISLYDPEENLLRFPYFVDEKTEYQGAFSRKPGGGITEYVMELGEPLLLTTEDMLRMVEEGEIVAHGEYAVDWLGIPLQARQKTIGVLAVQSYDPGVRYFEREKNILSFVSRQVAMTIDRKRAEAELARERQQLAVTLRSIGDGVITTNTEGQIQLMNKMAEQLTGWSEKEAKGKNLDDVFPLVNKNTHEPFDYSLREVITQRKSVSLPPQTILKTRQGGELLIADSISPLSDENSKVIGAVLVFRDETEKRQMERELLKSRKLESVGTLAGGIAHDFNNILAGILGNISLAKLNTGDQNKVDELLQNAERAAKRASSLTNQLLTFSKGGAPVKETSSIADILRESVKFALHGSNVRYELKISDDLWAAEVDPGQIDQVINNVILNADQAMPSGGTIRIRAENIMLESSLSAPLFPGAYIKISITDSGVGIPEEDLEKIFDPYFSTKDMGHGLGLATCYSIVQKHGGKIEAESEVGRGTTMTIYLPARKEKQLEIETKTRAKILTGEGKVLLMDDDKTVLEIASEMLTRLGYDVTTASDGDEAIHLYKNAIDTNEHFDVVILDLTIPGGKGGKVTAEEILDIDPEANMLVSSGYSTDQIMANYEEYGFQWKVAKPYNLEELSQALNRVLQKN